ncbi:hypothetical protein GYMLUDRAFT_243691 [Collybiopsis luxurians FD-317 M1]|uniref:Uncharacterized protein n=1 Tax=Collybiopsis luxurians FD-317 M1 TaxID=944289 RepID=A0A0D0CXP0_9AGAR|nr:hypothetical protein GYMLUDRAFT_243691 [Collybiopsis luxurians FD-317 M1]
MTSSEFRPTSAALRNFKAVSNHSDHPLREFADYILKIQRGYEEGLSEDLKRLIAVVYEFGVAKIDREEKTDPRELDRLADIMGIVALAKDTSEVLYQQIYFEMELSRIRTRSSSPTTFATPPEQLSPIVLRDCHFYNAQGGVYVTTNNDYSVTSNCHNKSNFEFITNSEIERAAFRQPFIPNHKFNVSNSSPTPAFKNPNDIHSRGAARMEDHLSRDCSVFASTDNSWMSQTGFLDGPGTDLELTQGHCNFLPNPLKHRLYYY